MWSCHDSCCISFVDHLILFGLETMVASFILFGDFYSSNFLFSPYFLCSSFCGLSIPFGEGQWSEITSWMLKFNHKKHRHLLLFFQLFNCKYWEVDWKQLWAGHRSRFLKMMNSNYSSFVVNLPWEISLTELFYVEILN